MQLDMLQTLVERYQNKFICKETMLLLLLAGNPEQLSSLKKLDSVYQMIQTSLQFQQYRRASWYLLVFIKLCRQNMGDTIVEHLQSCLTAELSKP